MPRKRTRDEMEASEPEEQKQGPSLVQRIRNMWEFASVMQFIFMFGKALKIDEDFDIEDFENECLKPGYSEKLEEIGLTLLKWISSHRGLNYDIWDEYTRRQYLAKAPQLNPYGDEEEPKRFRQFDICTRIRVLHQLTVWTFWNPDRIREKMPEHQREIDQTEWRLEEFGYDKDDRQYYLLDDNRLYRRTDPPLPAAPKAKPKASSKKAMAARRRESKRRKMEAQTPDIEEDNQENNEESQVVEEKSLDSWEIDTFGGFKWECLAITLPDYQEFCESLKKSKDPNEKALRERLLEEVIPVIEAAEEKQRRKIERRERELLMMERMVGAKRSGRLADKQEREKREAEEAELERKRQADLAAAHKEQEKQEKMEQERQYRMMTREQRIKDREFKRILKEEELARDALEQKRIEDGEIRGSGRHLKERIERTQKELEDLNAEEEWNFDCSGCGIHGKNLDDGSHSVACERCNVWQHSKCLGISKSAAEKDDFHFICKDCKRKEEDAKKPKISLKFRVGTSSSPVPPSPAPVKVKTKSPRKPKFTGVEVPGENTTRPPSQSPMTNGYQFHQYSPPGQQSSSPYRQPAQSSSPYRQPAQSNGLYSHQYPQHTYGSPQHAQPGSSPQRQTSSSPQQHFNSFAQGYGARPPYPGHSFPPLQPAPTNGPAGSSPPPATGQNQYQYRAYTPGQRPLAPSPNPTPSQNPNGLPMPNSGRLPSPVVNRPTMSPTQGNMDVGPVAGIFQRSPQANPQFSNNSMGTANGVASGAFYGGPQATPRPAPQHQSAQTPTPASQPLSGLSPTKHQTPSPLPPPTMIPSKSNAISPPPSGLQRPVAPPTVGPSTASSTGPGVPTDMLNATILPPIENLRPSPEQLKNMSSNEPVPTPSKQPQPVPQPQPTPIAKPGVENGTVPKTENVVNAPPNPNTHPSTQAGSEAGQTSVPPKPEVEQTVSGTGEPTLPVAQG